MAEDQQLEDQLLDEELDKEIAEDTSVTEPNEETPLNDQNSDEELDKEIAEETSFTEQNKHTHNDQNSDEELDKDPSEQTSVTEPSEEVLSKVSSDAELEEDEPNPLLAEGMADEIEDEMDEESSVVEPSAEAGVDVTSKVSSDAEIEDEGNKELEDKPSDFEIMMERRKDAMSRARKRRARDVVDISSVDDHISAMLQQMKYAAEEDFRLNLQKKPAVKKLTMLPTVISQLKKVDLLTAFIESGMCSALADWLKPLPDHSLPHLKIREDILDILFTFPEMNSHVLKTSGLGKAIMLLYRHPSEIKKNRGKAGKLINTWSRPIFGLNSDYKALNRDEREERDWARLSQVAKRRLSNTDGGESSQGGLGESTEGQKPGEKGFIGRARVPMPSHKDYVVRPKWNVDRESQKGLSKKTLNRYEKHLQKRREKQTRIKNTHAISISVEGRKMPL